MGKEKSYSELESVLNIPQYAYFVFVNNVYALRLLKYGFHLR
jgi:hypothetical protein